MSSVVNSSLIYYNYDTFEYNELTLEDSFELIDSFFNREEVSLFDPNISDEDFNQEINKLIYEFGFQEEMN